jgi:hypothetical protein
MRIIGASGSHLRNEFKNELIKADRERRQVEEM